MIYSEMQMVYQLVGLSRIVDSAAGKQVTECAVVWCVVVCLMYVFDGKRLTQFVGFCYTFSHSLVL